MPDYTKALKEYAKELSANLARRDYTEHTHRPALKKAIEALFPKTVATNEPRRIEAGAPDYIISKGPVNIGYIEAKDIGKNLREIEKDEQLKRYRASLPNLILTDYVEFRWYTDGQLREAATLGMVTDDSVKPSKESLEQVYSLLNRFMQHRVPSVGTAKDLACRMADLARMIRSITAETFKQEEQTGTLHAQYESFKQVLLPDLKPEEFADMFAQTVAYGLFAARVHSGKPFNRQNAVYALPKTNPFLQKLFGHMAGVELDDRVAWIVDDLAQVLEDADMGSILEDFGNRTRKEDPVVHFYETFLAEYNPKMRELRGVYYTPEPVISYIVRSVDHLLQTKFHKPLGLADPEVMILDPACGTGTFLFYVVKLIHERFTENQQLGSWNSYVEEKLLPRLFGFELLVAPYTIAHLKMGMLLEEYGYEFKSDQRLGIYLTNSLQPGEQEQPPIPFAEYITEEANAAADIKQTKPIMVVLGNPPYSVRSQNRSTWIVGLLDDYKKNLREKKLNLDDDYIKFIRFGQWRIDETGHGILAFISNNSYVDGITHRRMRESLMETFSDISILDLHGNAKKKEHAPDGSQDDNVFDIQQGVAIGVFVKEQEAQSACKVHHEDLWGSRDDKYEYLQNFDIAETDWLDVLEIGRTTCLGSPFFFTPKAFDNIDEYCHGKSIRWLFPVNQNGLKTDRDELFFDFSKDSLEERMRRFYSAAGLEQGFKREFNVNDSSSYDLLDRRKKTRLELANVQQCLYRPFDFRWLYYALGLTSRPAWEVMRHVLLGPNLALIATRQTQETWSVLTTRGLAGHKSVAAYDINSVFPLYLYPELQDKNGQNGFCLDSGPWPLSEKGRRPNLSPEFVADLKKRLVMEFVTDGKGDLRQTFGPEDIFHYIYAVFHSPTYRTRYAEALKIDFPRVPLTSDKGLFRKLAEKGAELVSLHLMESPALNKLITSYPVAGSDVVEKVEYFDTLKRVNINKEQYFEGVEPEVWEFHIGGYQVLDKWLKDRKGRKLTYDDQRHYQKIAVALKETMRLMQEIDAIIPSWPIE